MRFQAGDIIAFQQPVQLLPCQCHDNLGILFWPEETLLFQALLPPAKAITLLIQNLDAGTLPVAEHEQGFGKEVLLPTSLRQPADSQKQLLQTCCIQASQLTGKTIGKLDLAMDASGCN